MISILKVKTLCLLIFIAVIGFNGHSQNRIFAPTKSSQTLFVSVEDNKAFVYEVYRLPNKYGTAKRTIDEMNLTSANLYSSAKSELNISQKPYKLKIAAFNGKSNFMANVEEKSDKSPYNRALNQALLSSTAYQIDSTARKGYKNANFPSVLLEKRFYVESEITSNYRQYEAKMHDKLMAFSDSSIASYQNVLNTYNSVHSKTGTMEVKALIETYKTLASNSNYVDSSPYSEIVNELANENPTKFYDVARDSKYQDKVKMFNALSRKSRKYLLRNGPENEVSDELKKNYSRNTLKTVALIGIPSAIIVTGAILIQPKTE